MVKSKKRGILKPQHLRTFWFASALTSDSNFCDEEHPCALCKYACRMSSRQKAAAAHSNNVQGLVVTDYDVGARKNSPGDLPDTIQSAMTSPTFPNGTAKKSSASEKADPEAFEGWGGLGFRVSV